MTLFLGFFGVVFSLTLSTTLLGDAFGSLSSSSLTSRDVGSSSSTPCSPISRSSYSKNWSKTGLILGGCQSLLSHEWTKEKNQKKVSHESKKMNNEYIEKNSSRIAVTLLRRRKRETFSVRPYIFVIASSTCTLSLPSLVLLLAR